MSCRWHTFCACSASIHRAIHANETTGRTGELQAMTCKPKPKPMQGVQQRVFGRRSACDASTRRPGRLRLQPRACQARTAHPTLSLCQCANRGMAQTHRRTQLLLYHSAGSQCDGTLLYPAKATKQRSGVQNAAATAMPQATPAAPITASAGPLLLLAVASGDASCSWHNACCC